MEVAPRYKLLILLTLLILFELFFTAFIYACKYFWEMSEHWNGLQSDEQNV